MNSNHQAVEALYYKAQDEEDRLDHTYSIAGWGLDISIALLFFGQLPVVLLVMKQYIKPRLLNKISRKTVREWLTLTTIKY